MDSIRDIIRSSIEVKNQILQDENLISKIKLCKEIITKSFEDGKKVLFCGNGGSAADAQHLAAEFSGRFYLDREPLYSEALHCNSSFMTAVSNDYGFDFVYSRAIKAIGKNGDVLICISTSGNSQNVVNAILEAKKIGMKCIAFTGLQGGILKNCSDVLINIPSDDIPRIQESHIMIGHVICELVEKNIFNK